MKNQTVKNKQKTNTSKYLDLTSYFVSCVNKRLFYLLSPILITISLNFWLNNNMRLDYFFVITLMYLVIMIIIAIIGYKQQKKTKQSVVRKVSFAEKIKTFGIMFILTIMELIIFGYAQLYFVIR